MLFCKMKENRRLPMRFDKTDNAFLGFISLFLIKILICSQCASSNYQIVKMVHSIGFEPTTFAFGGQCSIQLSYKCLMSIMPKVIKNFDIGLTLEAVPIIVFSILMSMIKKITT